MKIGLKGLGGALFLTDKGVYPFSELLQGFRCKRFMTVVVLLSYLWIHFITL
jgi:hypothetical protein